MNCVFILAPYHNSSETAVDQFESMYKMVEKYNKNICFLLNQFDICEDENKLEYVKWIYE
jgi:hypothetical protein